MHVLRNWTAKRSGAHVRVYGTADDGGLRTLQAIEIKGYGGKVIATDIGGQQYELAA